MKILSKLCKLSTKLAEVKFYNSQYFGNTNVVRVVSGHKTCRRGLIFYGIYWVYVGCIMVPYYGTLCAQIPQLSATATNSTDNNAMSENNMNVHI